MRAGALWGVGVSEGGGHYGGGALSGGGELWVGVL